MKNQLFITLVLVLVSQLSWASSVNSTVTNVRIDKNGKGYIVFSSAISGNAACSTHANHLAFDTTTDGGEAIFSLGVAAKATGDVVWASGTSACDVYGTVESWNWGYSK